LLQGKAQSRGGERVDNEAAEKKLLFRIKPSCRLLLLLLLLLLQVQDQPLLHAK
jgi:hypothetical protein